MDKKTIISEIQRVAAELGSNTLGQGQFEKLSGISVGSWRGKFWLRWSDAMAEAGLSSGKMSEAHSEELLLKCLADLAKKYGRFPVYSEIKMARTQDKAFPHHSAFDRLGDKPSRISSLRKFAAEHAEFADILEFLPSAETTGEAESLSSSDVEVSGDGYVYMLKHGKHYKVGKTFDVPRRHRQIALELPEKPVHIHSIRTDDPFGIETYWKRRFEKKGTNGEWFLLDLDDVKAFKRRKFM